MKIFLFVSVIFPIIFPNNFYHFEWKFPIQNDNIISFYPQSDYYSEEVKNARKIIWQELAEKFPHETIFQSAYWDFVVFPTDLAAFITKNDQIWHQPATTFSTDAYYFLFDSDKKLIKNTDEIDENTNFVILARVNYGFDLYNKNGKYFWEDYYDVEKDFWKISELNTFIGEKFFGKCAKLQCKIDKKSLPKVLLESFENELHGRLDLHEEFSHIAVTENEIILHFSPQQKIMDYFVLSEWHHY